MLCVYTSITSFILGPKGPLVRRKVLPKLQQLRMFLGVHPPQVLHMLNHHLHGFTHPAFLQYTQQTWGQQESYFAPYEICLYWISWPPRINLRYSNTLTWWMAPSISERLDTLVMDWTRTSRFFCKRWMISMDWLSSSHRGIKACTQNGMHEIQVKTTKSRMKSDRLHSSFVRTQN